MRLAQYLGDLLETGDSIEDPSQLEMIAKVAQLFGVTGCDGR
jgi:hypothetical protein